MKFPTSGFSLDILEMAPVIYSEESALERLRQYDHALELIRMEFVHLKSELWKNISCRTNGVIEQRRESLKKNAKRVFWEKECLLICMGLVTDIKNNNLPAN